jgi:hypothetical protein
MVGSEISFLNRSKNKMGIKSKLTKKIILFILKGIVILASIVLIANYGPKEVYLITYCFLIIF